MSPIRVKVCGLTRAADVELAVALGAWAVGFIFHPPSPRCVDAETARRLGAGVPPSVRRVGVFVNQPLDALVRAVRLAGIDAVQLHGDETPADFAAAVAALDVPVVRALRPRAAADLAALAHWRGADALLVDAAVDGAYGGTGRLARWDLARDAGAAAGRIILSGGLDPDNVEAAIAAVRPYAVDVCSGVEARPGVKDEERMRRFFGAVARASAAEEDG